MARADLDQRRRVVLLARRDRVEVGDRHPGRLCRLLGGVRHAFGVGGVVMHDGDLAGLQPLLHEAHIRGRFGVVAADHPEDVVVTLVGEFRVARRRRDERQVAVAVESIALRDRCTGAIAAHDRDDLLGQQLLGGLDTLLRVACVVGVKRLELPAVDAPCGVNVRDRELAGIPDRDAGVRVRTGEGTRDSDIDRTSVAGVVAAATAGCDQQRAAGGQAGRHESPFEHCASLSLRCRPPSSSRRGGARVRRRQATTPWNWAQYRYAVSECQGRGGRGSARWSPR